jgi:hypothetical protein
MGRGAVLILACAICAAVVPSTAPAAPFKPRVGKYAGTTAGTYSPNSLRLQVMRRGRAFRSRVLKLSDDCAGYLLPTPVGLGRVFAKDIKYEASGSFGTLSWGLKIEGVFKSPTRVTITARSYQNNPSPLPGSPPSATTICRDDTTFALRYRKAKK